MKDIYSLGNLTHHRTNKNPGKKSPEYIQSLSHLANLYQKTQKYKEADSLYTLDKEITEEVLGKENPYYTTIVNNMAVLANKMSQYEKAARLYEECLNIDKQTLGEQHPYYTLDLYNLAVNYTHLQKYGLSETFFKQAVQNKLREFDYNFSFLSEKEKGDFYKINQKLFEDFGRFALMRSGHAPDLKIPENEVSKPILGDWYNLQLQTKAILLNASQKIKKRILSSKDTVLIGEYEQWQNITNSIAQVSNMNLTERKNQNLSLDSLINRANLMEKNLSLRSQDFRENYNPPVPTWKAIKKNLKKHEAAIEIIRVDYAPDTIYYVGLVIHAKTKDYPEIVLLQNGSQLENRYLKYYRNTISFKKTDNVSYEQFWQPFQPKLKGIRKVYISPDGVYNQINLKSLFNPSTQKYLLDEIEIQPVTNTKDLLGFINNPGTHSNFSSQCILFGRPSYSMDSTTYQSLAKDLKREINEEHLRDLRDLRNAEFSDLVGTEKEVNNIALTFQKQQWQTQIYLKEMALEENLKAVQNPTVLHIATHGFFITSEETDKTDAMLRSGIILAGVKTPKPESMDNGILTAYEAMNLHLDDTDLVVLSACETGLGEVKAGEGVYGLQRALKVAGAKTILMSLWKVDDNATQALMSEFYQIWVQTHDKQKAFHLAQKKIRTQYPEPYYWGAFVMVGE